MSFTENVLADVLSLGWGTQSTCLAFMAAHGELPKPDFVIFADTLWEPEAVYEYEQYALPLLRERGIEVITVSKGDLLNEILGMKPQDRFLSIPLWFKDPETGRQVPIRRQCTSEYKVRIIQRKVRELLGKKRLPRHSVRMWMGITADENRRVKKLYDGASLNHYPFIGRYAELTDPTREYRDFRRQDCLDWFSRHGYRYPVKSSCIFCPFHNNDSWADMKKNRPQEFEIAVEVDRTIRNYNTYGSWECGNFFLHHSLRPLEEIDFDAITDQETETGQLELFSGCKSGYCFV